jgi:hypothetical protein
MTLNQECRSMSSCCTCRAGGPPFVSASIKRLYLVGYPVFLHAFELRRHLRKCGHSEGLPRYSLKGHNFGAPLNSNSSMITYSLISPLNLQESRDCESYAGQCVHFVHICASRLTSGLESAVLRCKSSKVRSSC